MKNFSPLSTIDLFKNDYDKVIKIVLSEHPISAGFPSPAEDFIDKSIDLNEELIKNPSSTFFGRVKGKSLIELGIDNNDLMIIDRSIKPQSGKVAVCFIDGEFTAKVLRIEKDSIWLLPANSAYKPIYVTQDNDFRIWGIVTYCIKALL